MTLHIAKLGTCDHKNGEILRTLLQLEHISLHYGQLDMLYSNRANLSRRNHNFMFIGERLIQNFP